MATGADRLRQALSLNDFQRLARPRLPRAVYGYVANGCEAGDARDHNRAAFAQWRMVTRVLRDVSARSQKTSLFGATYASPFGIAPMGASAVVAFDADNRMARAARAANIPFVLSANSITPIEELVRSNPNAWFAAYQSPDARNIERMVARVAATGIKVFVLTVDVPVPSNREDDRRAGYSMPLRPTPRLSWDGVSHPRWLGGTAARTLLTRGIPHISNVEADNPINLFSRKVAVIAGHDNFTWKQAELIRGLWKGTFVIKGLLSAADAAIARDLGADGIVVSNHGGRQLDAAVSPMQVLREIKAASGAMTVIVDSGFRRGNDVLKAVALGADFVLIGRPFLFAATLAGTRGVRHAISLLAKEIDIDLALLGLDGIGAVDADVLWVA
ncbi:alpha-hydroxy acid oxidase [Lichenicoccus sp.]|uniref:alpha-hydroxy acid oxidase n=1 Tax=Lichenicoccus sp. TaxID=2781899 RepID=UPI003D0DE324